MPRQNQTGVAEWAIMSWAICIIAPVAWFCGAGWWSLLAFPAMIGLYMWSVNRRYPSKN